MKIPALFRFLFCAFVATALSLTAAAQTAAGQIKAAKVEGQVTKISATGTSSPLKSGDMLVETDAVLTGKGASVVLVFSNGSSVKVGAESRLAIDEFKMDPLVEEMKLSEMKAEPTTSKTTLNLSYGEMVGDVKKLNKSSSYSIKTPVGAAGIRGTIYRIVFTLGANGKAFFTISTAEGHVVMEGITDAAIPVDEGKEVVVEIDTDNPTNPIIVTQDIPPATQELIRSEAKVLTEVLVETVLPAQSSTDSTTKDAKKDDPPPDAPDSPPTEPNLSPGA